MRSRAINKVSRSFFGWIVGRIGYGGGSEWRRLNFGPGNCWRHVGLGLYWRTRRDDGPLGMSTAAWGGAPGGGGKA